jgi:tetratricopeptide (TPR) repeat protein
MRTLICSIPLAILLLASPALANWGKEEPPPPSAPRTEQPDGSSSGGASETPRGQAELWYGDGYREVVRAAMDVKRGKPKDAAKRWKKAREKLQRATELDTTYIEAWNLIGFTSRKLGEYPESFAAYLVALRQKPDYAEAREYYGQGLLETGDLEGAKTQLDWLKKIGNAELTASLEQSIREYEAEHPAAAAADSLTGDAR